MLSATVFLTLFSGGNPVTRPANLPSFEDFHRQLWSNELELADNSLKIANGLIHWNRLLENMRQARVEGLERSSTRRTRPFSSRNTSSGWRFRQQRLSRRM